MKLPRLLLTGLAALSLWAAARAQEPATRPAADIRQLVANLGDRDYKVRQQAQKQLTEIGSPAKAELEKAAQSGDAEVKQRAEEILAEIQKGEFAARSQEIAKKLLWTCPLKGGLAGGPAIGDGVACAVSGDGSLHVIDLKTGKVAWTYDVSVRAELSPTVIGKLAFVSTKAHSLTALDLDKKAALWTAELVFDPGLPAVSEGVVYVGDLAGNFYAIAPNGERKWKIGGGCIGRPAVCGDLIVYVIAGRQTGPGQVAAATVQAVNTKGEVVWSFEPSGNYWGLTQRGGTVYFRGGDALVALNAKDGKKLWQAALPADDAGANTPFGGGMKVMVNGVDMQPGAWLGSGLAVGDGLVVATSGGSLLVVDAASGEKKWQHKLDLKSDDKAGGNDNPVNAGNGVVVMGGAGGNVQAKLVVWARVGGGWVGRGQSGPGIGEIALADGVAYLALPAGIHAVDVKTGQQLWRVADSVSGGPVLVNGVLYFGTAPNRPPGPASPDPAKEESFGLKALKVKG